MNSASAVRAVIASGASRTGCQAPSLAVGIIVGYGMRPSQSR
jgi:hypothetical protein